MPRIRSVVGAQAALRAKVAWLAQPDHYPHRPRAVEIIETHFAWVFLAGDRVYKFKKPLLQATMDYRTLARRGRACREELRLNRRLAPHVYLRVVPLLRASSGSLSLRPRQASGAMVVDWLVQMRRLRASRMLDRLISAGAVHGADLARPVSPSSLHARSIGRWRTGHIAPGCAARFAATRLCSARAISL